MTGIVEITKLNDLNTLVIKKSKNSNFFISTDNSIIITINNLMELVQFLIDEGFIDGKTT